MQTIEVDAMGLPCPEPVVKTTNALRQLQQPATVQVHVDNETAVENLLRLADNRSIPAHSEKTGDRHYVVTLQYAGPEKDVSPEPQVAEKNEGDLVVAIAGRTMGDGSDELGSILMKAFIYALTEAENLPKSILFYNSGARLTTEGSAFLNDLKQLEARGVEILTCGTCLDYFSLKDKLAVGSVTNMYTIVTKLSNARTVMRP